MTSSEKMNGFLLAPENSVRRMVEDAMRANSGRSGHHDDLGAGEIVAAPTVDAVAFLQLVAAEFMHVVTEEAVDIAQGQNRKTVTVEAVLKAARNLGLEHYARVLGAPYAQQQQRGSVHQHRGGEESVIRSVPQVGDAMVPGMEVVLLREARPQFLNQEDGVPGEGLFSEDMLLAQSDEDKLE
jgi:histone H3/H4